MHVRTATLALLSLSALSLAARQDPVEVKWKPAAGVVIKYKMEVNASGIEGPSGAGELKISSTLTRTIKELLENGNVNLEEAQTDLSIVFDGQDLTEMVGARSFTTTMKVAPNGETLEKKSDTPEQTDNPRLENATAFVYPSGPIAIGGTWTREKPADATKNVPSTVTTFTLKAIEDVDKFKTYKIDIEFKEGEGSNPMSATGTVWINVADGELVKGNYTIKAVEFAPGIIADATSTLTRIE